MAKGGKFAVAEPRTSRRRAVGRQVAPKRIQYSLHQSVQWSFAAGEPSPDANAGTPSSLPFPVRWQVWVSGLAGLDLPKELATAAANGDDDGNSNGN